MIVADTTTRYRVDELVAETAAYRVYVCTDESTDRQLLMQVATSLEYNGGLERAAFALREFQAAAQFVEEQEPDRNLRYDRLAPIVISSFIANDHGGRRINILEISDGEELSSFIPLSNLREKDRVRIDLPTSAWILGRLLKLFGLAHFVGLRVNLGTTSNILVESSRHRTLVFDWSGAFIHQNETPTEGARSDITQAAVAIITALGGDVASGYIPDVDEHTEAYAAHLLRLAVGQTSDAETVHKQHYKLTHATWGKDFRPIQTLPL